VGLLKIAIGADHRGVALKEFLKTQSEIEGRPIEWLDVGSFSSNPSDYPEYGSKVASLVQNRKADLGVLICGTGIGMSIVANRFKGVFAGLAWCKEVAQQAREHDHINVLVLPADYLSEDQAFVLVSAWLNAQPLDGKYSDRIKEINKL